MPVDIVIVNWNGRAELLEAIASGLRFGATVIVVDNASTEGAVGEVAAMPGVRLVRNQTNAGFSVGCNRGVAAGDGDIIMLLNPDAQIVSGTVVDLERVFAASNAMLVAFPIAQPSGDPVPSTYQLPTTRNLTADLLRLNSLGRRIGGHRRTEPIGVTPSAEPGWVVGAALAMRRADWERLGGMDEQFFLWYEDIDLGFRVAHAGGRIAIAHAIRIRHRGASTWGRLSRRRRQWLRLLGSRRLAAKHLGRGATAAIIAVAPAALTIGVALDGAHWVMRR